jgi:WD40 repeat protein
MVQASPPLASAELEHAIGFTGGIAQSLYVLPSGDEIVYVSGACVVVASLSDPHQQAFLRGHTEPISCLHVSVDGRLAASGQRGRIADVIVWDLVQRREIYRLQEHDAILDGGISTVAFSEDGRFLLTAGVMPEDRKLMVWDMRNGYIVTQVDRPAPTTCATWGGRVKDVKRRPTTHPQFITAGADGLRYWALDPEHGLTSEPCLTSNQKRVYTCVAFSAEEDFIFAGTLTGDFCVINVPRRLSSGEFERINLRLSVLVCSGGIHSLSVSGSSLYVGGGDGTVTRYETAYDEGYKPQKVADGLSGQVTSVHTLSGGSAARGSVAVYGTSSSTLYTHALQDARAKPAIVSENHCARVTAVAYAPGDSVRFATCSDDLTVRVWNASDYSVETTSLTRDGGRPLSLAFSGTAVFVGWEDGKIRAYESDEGAQIWAIDNAHRGGVSALVLSHNQRFLCSGGVRGECRVWELKTRTLVSHLVQHDDTVRLGRSARATPRGARRCWASARNPGAPRGPAPSPISLTRSRARPRLSHAAHAPCMPHARACPSRPCRSRTRRCSRSACRTTTCSCTPPRGTSHSSAGTCGRRSGSSRARRAQAG